MSKKEINLKKGKGLVLVAHPDDETIWMGGIFLSFPQINWTIFSLCRSDDKDRAPRFRKACRIYKAQSIISDLEDEGIMKIRESIEPIAQRVLRLLPKINFTYLFTHGYNGEYGHPRHKGVHLAAVKLICKKKLKAKKIFFFSYCLKKNKMINHPKSDLILNLNKKVYQKKKRIISEIYGFRSNSFEYKSALPQESFNIRKKL